MSEGAHVSKQIQIINLIGLGIVFNVMSTRVKASSSNTEPSVRFSRNRFQLMRLLL